MCRAKASSSVPSRCRRPRLSKLSAKSGRRSVRSPSCAPTGCLFEPSVGALVYQGDTIETGADGAVGITFIDGTAFNLSATSRLVLNEFSCERTGTPNSALFSLVQGAFSFRCRQGSQDRRPQDRYAFRNDPRQRARSRGRRPDARRIDFRRHRGKPGREPSRRVPG